jgi:hypothetical protein
MSNDGAFILGLVQGREDLEEGLPFRITIPKHLTLSMSEEASWWAGYHQGYNPPNT